MNSMNKVMAGLQQYQYEVYRNPEVGALGSRAPRFVSKQQCRVEALCTKRHRCGVVWCTKRVPIFHFPG